MNPKNEKNESYEAYMNRVGGEKIPCYEPTLGGQELEFLTDIVKRNWLSEGKYTREFEKRLADLCHRKYSLAFCNATAALISGMKSYDIGPGDEVIVPSFTHPADPNSIAATGATPVFADVDEKTLCLSVNTIEAVRTRKTKAILYVSLYGNTSPLDEIASYAQKHALKLINDCAPALFGLYRGKPIASYGDSAILSFFADKTITTGEGGMLLTDDANLVAEANIYKHDGRKERGVDRIDRQGYNFRITEMQAAIGVAQLNQAAGFVKRKKEILKSYKKRLVPIAEVQPFQFYNEEEVVPHRALIFAPRAHELIAYLCENGIGARTMFMPMHSQPCYNVSGQFPVTERLYSRGVCLPSAPTLKEEHIESICKTIGTFYKINR